MLVLSGKYGCFKYKYDETKNNFTFYNKTLNSMHNERVIGITKDHDLITVEGGFEHGITFGFGLMVRLLVEDYMLRCKMIILNIVMHRNFLIIITKKK